MEAQILELHSSKETVKKKKIADWKIYLQSINQIKDVYPEYIKNFQDLIIIK